MHELFYLIVSLIGLNTAKALSLFLGIYECIMLTYNPYNIIRAFVAILQNQPFVYQFSFTKVYQQA